MKKLLFFLILMISMMTTALPVKADPPGPPGPGGDPGGSGGVPVGSPIDGGLSLLLALGLGYGGFTLIKKKEVQDENKL